MNTLANENIVIAFEGNIGSGKSTFIKKFKEIWPNCEYIDEPLEKWQNINGTNVFKRYCEDMHKYAFTFQVLAFGTRLFDHIKPLNKTRICERSLYTDMLFAEMQYEDGFIDKIQYDVYKEIYTKTMMQMGNNKPNLILYIYTPAEECYRRKNIRCREGEENVSLSYLKSLESKHESWMNDECGITKENIIYLRIRNDFDINNNQLFIKNVIDKLYNFYIQKYATFQ